MSLTSALRPTPLSFNSPAQSSEYGNSNNPSPSLSFQQDPNYLALSRMVARYQNLILLTPAPGLVAVDELSPWQKKIQAELWSPLPYHRTKWLRNIEGARTILLQLERSAQEIKVQRNKRDAIRDLAEKRAVIKRLRSRVEDIGREVEAAGSDVRSQAAPEEDGETLFDYLQQYKKENAPSSVVDVRKDESNDAGIAADKSIDTGTAITAEREKLLDTKSNLRRRQGKEEETTDEGKSSGWGFSNLPLTEKSLLAASREHEDIASSLVSMAVQLKQQARQFQFSLDQDKGLLDRALEGLDQNVSAMGIASKGMGTLKRMSEEQGFLGRLKLYAIIFGMWVAAILLVFVGPKLRF